MKKIYIKWDEKFKCECRLDAIVCNNKQPSNKVKINGNVNVKN